MGGREKSPAAMLGQQIARLRSNESASPAVRVCMFEQSTLAETRNSLSDWMLLGAIALVFILEGVDKLVGASSLSFRDCARSRVDFPRSLARRSISLAMFLFEAI